MLLPLRRIVARPAEVLVALRALDMGAATLHFGNPNSTLLVGAELGALLHVDVVQPFPSYLVVFVDFTHFQFVFNKEIDPVNQAPLERMDVLLTVKAKVEIAMLAFACVLRLLNVRNCSTSWHRAPAHVVHLLNGVLQANSVILLSYFLAEAQVTHVQVIQILEAILVSAAEICHLPSFDLGHCHVNQTLGAEEVFASRKECKLVTE